MKTHSKLKPAEKNRQPLTDYRRAIDKNSKSSGAETSDYDSDGGTNYKPYKTLNSGAFDSARIFRAESGKKVVVLKPADSKDFDMSQAINKNRFFKTLYPTKQSHLFKYKKPEKDARHVVPFFPGYTFNERSRIDTLKKFFIYALDAVRKLKACHKKGLVIIDLNPANFIYTPSVDKPEVHLIDGGESRMIGERVDSKFCLKQSEVTKFLMQSSQIAPEIISTTTKSKRAAASMDYHALADTLNTLLQAIDRSSSLYPILIHPFLNRNAKDRPSLDIWEERLMACEYIFITTIQKINAISTDFSNCDSLNEVEKSTRTAQGQMDKLLCSKMFLEKCAVLGVDWNVPKEVYHACTHKTDEIAAATKQRKFELRMDAKTHRPF